MCSVSIPYQRGSFQTVIDAAVEKATCYHWSQSPISGAVFRLGLVVPNRFWNVILSQSPISGAVFRPFDSPADVVSANRESQSPISGAVFRLLPCKPLEFPAFSSPFSPTYRKNHCFFHDFVLQTCNCWIFQHFHMRQPPLKNATFTTFGRLAIYKIVYHCTIFKESNTSMKAF